MIFPIFIFSQEKVTIGKYTYELKTSQYISKKDTFYNQELINIENNKKAFWCPLKYYYGTGKFIIDEKKRKINGIWTRSVFYNFEDYKKALKKIYYEK